MRAERSIFRAELRATTPENQIHLLVLLSSLGSRLNFYGLASVAFLNAQMIVRPDRFPRPWAPQRIGGRRANLAPLRAVAPDAAHCLALRSGGWDLCGVIGLAGTTLRERLRLRERGKQRSSCSHGFKAAWIDARKSMDASIPWASAWLLSAVTGMPARSGWKPRLPGLHAWRPRLSLSEKWGHKNSRPRRPKIFLSPSFCQEDWWFVRHPQPRLLSRPRDLSVDLSAVLPAVSSAVGLAKVEGLAKVGGLAMVEGATCPPLLPRNNPPGIA